MRSLSGSDRQFPAAGLVFGDLVLFDERNPSFTTSHLSKASSPSIPNPASNEIISDSVELWDTDVCFLHIQPEVDFESSKSPAKSESWNNPNQQYSAVLPTRQYCLCDECKRSNGQNVCHKLWSMFVTRTSLCADQRMSSSPTVSSSSLLN